MRAIPACLVLVFGLAGAVSPALAQGPSNCSSTSSQNLWVRDVLTDWYYWYRFLPNADPRRYNSPEAYLETVRYRPIDAYYSYITSKASNDAFYSDSQYIGYGFATQISGREMRLLQVFDDSPALEAELARGDRVIEINGTSVETLINTGRIGGAFGPEEEGVVTRMVVAPKDGERRSVTLTKRKVTIPTVSLTRVFDVDGRKVGYVFFRNFVRPSYAALDSAFAGLREQGVRELVLDLRYNGGGLVDVATHLASLIGGSVTNGRIFAESRHNDKRAARYNEEERFRELEQALTLDRVVVITTRSSASASELVINGLRPHMQVVVVGDRTYGKPVGQYGFEFCDKILAPVAFSMVNSEGQGDYFDGIAADCPAADDIDHQLGTADEGSLAEALTFIRTGACTPRPEEETRALRALSAPRQATGWQSIVNAH